MNGMNTMNTMNTTKEYRFSLERGSKKFTCPDCKQKSFVKYKDGDTGDYLPDHVGRCDRENHCGYHYTPKQYFADNNLDTPPATERKEPEPPKPISFMPASVIERSMARFNESNFARYIITLFGKIIGEDLLLKYFVGRSKMYSGTGCIFWRIDVEGNIRTGKIMPYVLATGKRDKSINPTWVHSAKNPDGSMLFKDFNYELCFFGEHLIKEYPNKDIAICESEKTAIIASFFLPQFNWLAAGGASGCKWREYSVFKALKDKRVTFFPDFGIYNKKTGKTCYQEWSERATAIMERMPCSITVSTVLEKNIPESERVNDYDLADMLIKRDDRTGIALKDEYPAIWDYNYELSNIKL